MSDRMAIIKAHFQRADNGYYFYPAAFGGGYSVSSEEREQMLAEYQNLLNGSNEGSYALIATIVAILLVAIQVIEAKEWQIWAVISIMIVAFFAWQRTRTRAALAPIRKRRRDAPRRDMHAFDVAVGRAHGKTLALYPLVSFLMFLLTAGWFEYPIAVKLLGAVFFGFATILTSRVAIRTWLANRAERR